MLSQDQIDALFKFSDETDIIIVTRDLTEKEIDELGDMLMQWQSNPTADIAHQIISKFATDAPPDSEL